MTERYDFLYNDRLLYFPYDMVHIIWTMVHGLSDIVDGPWGIIDNFNDNIFRTHLHDLEVIVCHLRSAVKDESGKFKVTSESIK